MKLYQFNGTDRLERLQRWRNYCEKRAMRVLTGSLHLGKKGDVSEEEQKKKDIFLYKYYEYHFDLADRLITKLCNPYVRK